jgi:hypothetical protein
MKPRHRAIWSGLFRFGRNLADKGLAILRPPIRTASRNRVQRHGSLSGLTCNAVQPYSGPMPASLPRADRTRM